MFPFVYFLQNLHLALIKMSGARGSMPGGGLLEGCVDWGAPALPMDDPRTDAGAEK